MNSLCDLFHSAMQIGRTPPPAATTVATKATPDLPSSASSSPSPPLESAAQGCFTAGVQLIYRFCTLNEMSLSSRTCTAWHFAATNEIGNKSRFLQLLGPSERFTAMSHSKFAYHCARLGDAMVDTRLARGATQRVPLGWSLADLQRVGACTKLLTLSLTIDTTKMQADIAQEQLKAATRAAELQSLLIMPQLEQKAEFEAKQDSKPLIRFPSSLVEAWTRFKYDPPPRHFGGMFGMPVVQAQNTMSVPVLQVHQVVIAALATSKKLQSISMRGLLPCVDLSPLLACHQLQTLVFRDCILTPASLQVIRQMSELISLEAQGDAWQPDHLEVLLARSKDEPLRPELTKLQHISLAKTELEPEHVQELLNRSSSLTQLDAYNFSEACVAYLPEFKALQDLRLTVDADMYGYTASARFMCHLIRCPPSLIRLTFHRIAISEKDALLLGESTISNTLEELCFQDVKIASLEAISMMKSLWKLTFWKCGDIRSTHTIDHLTMLTRLSDLTISDSFNPPLSDAAVRSLTPPSAALPQLKNLFHFDGRIIGENGLVEGTELEDEEEEHGEDGEEEAVGEDGEEDEGEINFDENENIEAEVDSEEVGGESTLQGDGEEVEANQE